MPMTKRFTTEEIVAAYRETGSVWKAGRALGCSGQSVHERLRAIDYPMGGRRWNRAEMDEMQSLIERGLTIAQIANQLGRTYAGVACKLSELDISVPTRRDPKKLPRGRGYDKVSILKHLKALETTDVQITQYAKAHGMTIEMFVRAIQNHAPDRWAALAARIGDLPSKTCEYCTTKFLPTSGRQRFCTRQCGDESRRDASYFGGLRRTTIGLAEGVCQLCKKHGRKGLSSHHALGRENSMEVLIALCSGCHKLVTLLASRTFIDDREAWEALIGLAWARKHGAELANNTLMKPGQALYVCVELEIEMCSDEYEDE